MKLRGFVIGLLIAGVSPAFALRPFGKSPADKESAEPLRAAPLALIMSGRETAPSGWLEARAKLPSDCRAVRELSIPDCDDLLRCEWLGARANAIEAWSSGGAEAQSAAAEQLHRLADRIAAGGECGRDAEAQQRWAADRALSIQDDAQAQIALLLVLAADGPDVLSGAEAHRVQEALSRARSAGLASLTDPALVNSREIYRQARQRRQLLQRWTAIARLRELVARSWGASSQVPANCGAELLRNDLLEEQWRGYLVREIAPQALQCLSDEYPKAAAQRGLAPKDPGLAQQLARQIKEAAQQDAGGRGFAGDTPQAQAIVQLAQALALQAVVAEKRREPSRVTQPARPAVAAVPPRRAEPGESTLTVPRPNSSLESDDGSGSVVRWASESGAALGDSERYYATARQAKSAAQKRQLIEAMVVDLHRHFCAPLTEMDPLDVDAARTILAQRGVRIDEAVCSGEGDGSSYLAVLLREVPRLEQLRSAVALRSAAGLTALGQTRAAATLLESIPDRLRGTTWAVLAAWNARKAGDPIAASRAIASVSGDTLKRLQSSGNQDLTRLIAHAWVTSSAAF